MGWLGLNKEEVGGLQGMDLNCEVCGFKLVPQKPKAQQSQMCNNGLVSNKGGGKDSRSSKEGEEVVGLILWNDGLDLNLIE